METLGSFLGKIVAKKEKEIMERIEKALEEMEVI